MASQTTIGKKLVRRVILPVLGVTSALGIHSVHEHHATQSAAFTCELQAIATTAAAGFDGDLHRRIRTPSRPDPGPLIAWLRSVARAHGTGTDLSTFAVEGDRLHLVFTTTSESIPPPAPTLGTVRPVLDDGVPVTDEEPTGHGSDRLTAYAPIHSADGTPVGLLAASRDTAGLTAHQNEAATVTAGLLVLTLLALLGVMQYLGTIARSISGLARAVRRIEKGEPLTADDLPPHADRELAVLTRSVQHMARVVAERDRAHQQVQDVLRDNNLLREQILTNVSHELLTPVTALVAGCELMLHNAELGTDEVVEFAGAIHERAVDLGRMVDQAVVLSDLSSRKPPEHVEPHPVGEILRDVVRDIIAQRGGHTCRIHLSGDLDAMVLVEAQRLHIAARAVVDNAVCHAPPATDVAIVVGVPGNGREALVAVCDCGHGVDRELVEAVFETFQQGGDILVDKPRGLGLGLSVARLAMQSLGGEVELAATGPEGSTFRLRIPLVPSPDHAPCDSVAPA